MKKYLLLSGLII